LVVNSNTILISGSFLIAKGARAAGVLSMRQTSRQAMKDTRAAVRVLHDTANHMQLLQYMRGWPAGRAISNERADKYQRYRRG
jgi:hypothetical protein